MNMGDIPIISKADIYLLFVIQYNECKWYEFFKKRAYKQAADWQYALMRSEFYGRHGQALNSSNQKEV